MQFKDNSYSCKKKSAGWPSAIAEAVNCLTFISAQFSEISVWLSVTASSTVNSMEYSAKVLPFVPTNKLVQNTVSNDGVLK
jgi:hypothetical protein